MKGFTAMMVAAAASVSFVAAQGVTDKIAPKESAPEGCKPVFNGLFQVTVEDVSLSTGKKRDITALNKRASCAADGTLVVGLADGVLTDAKSRLGYIASNRQFQFDGPPQAGAIYTAGFSVCGNNSLALGGSTVWYQCLSGDFYNLYDQHWAPQCSPVQIVAMPCGSTNAATQIPDGQVVGTTVVATTVVVPLSDGQPQVVTTTVPVPLCQISDGQIQGKTTPCASITPAAPTTQPAPVSQFSDGQIQVTPPGTAPPPPATTSAAAPPPPVTTSAAPAPPPSSSAPAPPPSATTSAPAPPASQSTTLVSVSTSSSASSSSSAPTTSSSAPATPNGAGSLKMSSVAALIVGIVAAVACL